MSRPKDLECPFSRSAPSQRELAAGVQSRLSADGDIEKNIEGVDYVLARVDGKGGYSLNTRNAQQFAEFDSALNVTSYQVWMEEGDAGSLQEIHITPDIRTYLLNIIAIMLQEEVKAPALPEPAILRP